MTRATYQSGEEPLPGDLVRRTGESVSGHFDMIKGRQFIVQSLDERGYLAFDGVPGTWRPRGFSLVQRKEGGS